MPARSGRRSRAIDRDPLPVPLLDLALEALYRVDDHEIELAAGGEADGPPKRVACGAVGTVSDEELSHATSKVECARSRFRGGGGPPTLAIADGVRTAR